MHCVNDNAIDQNNSNISVHLKRSFMLLSIVIDAHELTLLGILQFIKIGMQK